MATVPAKDSDLFWMSCDCETEWNFASFGFVCEAAQIQTICASEPLTGSCVQA